MKRATEEEILIKYRDGKADADEIKWVEGWLLNRLDLGFDLTDEELLEDLIIIRKRLNIDKPQRRILPIKGLAIAASLLIVASISIFFFLQDEQNNTVSKNDTIANIDIPAGDNLATLTLSDGSTIKLDSTVGGIIKENGIEIENDANGNLTYIINSNKNADGKLAYNTISTPRGGTYKIVLPDGTKVWLNAASSLRFPLSFEDNVRKVELTGEGYFEVSKSKNRFKVAAQNTVIEVLGTHFNVNSYINENATNVTLLEGSVKLISGNVSALLKPGEQGQIPDASNSIQVNTSRDTESIIAWTNGQFKFNNSDLKGIMRQLERWYDIDVDLNSIPDKKFNGTISREANLSEVLSMIELTSDLKFKMKGRSLTMN